MRDIARDASLVVLVRHLNTSGTFMSVEAFLETYASDAEDKVDLLNSLALLDLVVRRYEREAWELDGKYKWYWVTDDNP